tara:strand:- start:657 stop:1415 length:759 start_codon:yes stop_codon:yes gene_type:complete
MVMEKAKLTRYLDKVRLGNKITQTQVTTHNKKTHSAVATDSKDCLVVLKMDNSPLNDSAVGIGDIQKLSNLLQSLGQEISFDVTSVDRDGEQKAVEVNCKDDFGNKAKYMLHDTSVVPKATDAVLKTCFTQEWEIKFTMDSNFVSKFMRGKQALGDEIDTFTVLTDNGNTSVCIGWRTTHSNRLEIPVTPVTYAEIDKFYFNSEVMAEILNVNKECETGTFEMVGGDRPLIKLSFNIDDYSAVYFLQSRVAM